VNYRSFSQLSDQVWRWSAELPNDIDLLVGIPRSGMIVATLLAAYRNVQVADLDGFLEGRLWQSGNRLRRHSRGDSQIVRKVLVVDDSVWAGTSMRRAKERISAAGLSCEVLYGAVYVNPRQSDEVDFSFEYLPKPRIFEWNVMQSGWLTRSCMDFDSVLLEDSMVDLTREISLQYLPGPKVGWVLASRGEESRSEIEDLLGRSGVKYGELVLIGSSQASAESRLAFKVETYRATSAKLFFEGSLYESVCIADLSYKPVFCVSTRQMIERGSVPLPRFTGQGRSVKEIIRGAAKRNISKIYRTFMLG
jgi:orotate phosphoribosyltransferase